MALQGNLRDFSVTEILQLLGSQKKTGCLLLERGAERVLLPGTEGGGITMMKAPWMANSRRRRSLARSIVRAR